MPNARKVAVYALIAVDRDGSYSNIAVDNAIKKSSLEGADSALCSALVYGVLDRRNAIDYIIEKNSSKPVKKLSLYVLEVLRISVLQLVFMDKIPPFAAINEAVQLVKKSKDRYASGFVNAVLRSVQRTEVKLPEGDDIKSLSVTLSCDEGIVERVVADYGVDTARQILASPINALPIFLRVNPLKCSANELVLSLREDGVTASIIDGMPNTLSVRGAIEKTKSYKNGWFHVQDMSCQLACEALKAETQMKVLDVCAAPGGKSFTLAGIMNDSGKIVSRDIHPHRVKLIEQGAKRLAMQCIEAKVGDATKFDNSLGLFDRVLCDVPCSGVGVIGRKPDIRYKSADEFDALAELQYSILETSSKYVKKGGAIVYSTCTVLKAENEAVFALFLKNHPEFEPMPFEDGAFMRTILPNGQSDGFFFARARHKD